MAKVAINGLGRIGRATLKAIIDRAELDLVAINDIVPPENLAYLLKYDTVYGRYHESVEAEDSALVIGGKKYPVYNKKDPSELPWSDLGVEIAFECTGVFTKAEGMRKHLEAGARQVVLSAPAKSEGVPTIVHGVNEADGDAEMISTASCTTNCIAPVMEIMHRRLGVRKATMTTVHAYTSTQGLVDEPAKKRRRGRAAAQNIVPTSTGAAIATTQALPELEGQFDGVALRVPVPVGSIADIVFVAGRETSVEEVNDIFREESRSDRYKEVVAVSEDEIVSSDIIGDPHGSIVELTMTQVIDGDLVKVMSWYDNEWGYACQMVREAVKRIR